MIDPNEIWKCPKCEKTVKATATRCVWCFERIKPVLGVADAHDTDPDNPAGRIGANDTDPGGNATDRGVASLQPPTATTDMRTQYRYRVVPFIGTIKSGFFSSDNAETVSAQLQRLIERHAQQGWEFYSLEKVGIEVSPGCLGRLLGQSAAYINFDQLIFRQGL